MIFRKIPQSMYILSIFLIGHRRESDNSGYVMAAILNLDLNFSVAFNRAYGCGQEQVLRTKFLPQNQCTGSIMSNNYHACIAALGT